MITVLVKVSKIILALTDGRFLQIVLIIIKGPVSQVFPTIFNVLTVLITFVQRLQMNLLTIHFSGVHQGLLNQVRRLQPHREEGLLQEERRRRPQAKRPVSNQADRSKMIALEDASKIQVTIQFVEQIT